MDRGWSPWLLAGVEQPEPLSLSLPARQRSAPATTQIERKDGRWLLQGGDRAGQFIPP